MGKMPEFYSSLSGWLDEVFAPFHNYFYDARHTSVND